MKKKFVAIMMVAAMAASMAACGSDGGSSDTQKGGSSTTTSDVANKDKPLVWFNRQPSNSSTGELDTTALNYNKDTYYVGFDANQGAELQGEMVKEYIEKNIDTIDRNGDGVIGYVLAIGDIGHNDSIARTRGVRKALGTGVDKSGEIDSAPAGTNSDGKAAGSGRKDYCKRQRLCSKRACFTGDEELSRCYMGCSYSRKCNRNMVIIIWRVNRRSCF